MKPDAFQVCVADNWPLSEKLQQAAFEAGYLWAGVRAEISGHGAAWLVFEPPRKEIYYSSQPEHQTKYGREIPSAEAFRRFKGIDFRGIDCTIPEGD
jgi:hypothetical protein